MSKNFTGKIKTAVQPAPAELLISNKEKEVDEPSQKESVDLVKKAFEIIETFQELDLATQYTVFEQLAKILREASNEEVDDYLTIEETALLLGVSERTVRNYLKNGKLQGIKKGKRWLFSRKNIEKLT